MQLINAFLPLFNSYMIPARDLPTYVYSHFSSKMLHIIYMHVVQNIRGTKFLRLRQKFPYPCHCTYIVERSAKHSQLKEKQNP